MFHLNKQIFEFQSSLHAVNNRSAILLIFLSSFSRCIHFPPKKKKKEKVQNEFRF